MTSDTITQQIQTHQHIIWQVDGLFENVLKFKPPLAFSMRDADTLVVTVDRALTEWAQVRRFCLLACLCMD